MIANELFKKGGSLPRKINLTEGYMSDKVYIKIKNIYKNFGNLKVLKDFSMDILDNKITSIVGDNGSGKSTVAKIISGTVKPDSGKIYIKNKEFNYLSPETAIENGISMIYQDLSLDNQRDVVSNIFLGQEITTYGLFLNRKKMEETARELLKELNVNVPYLTTPVGFLSGGQRQAVALARGLYQGKKIIIADEPTAAMGIKETQATINFLSELPSKGFGVLLISHNLHHVYDISDEIKLINDGLIMYETNKNEISFNELENQLRDDFR